MQMINPESTTDYEMSAKFSKTCFYEAISYWESKTRGKNSVDPNEVAHHDPP